MKETCQPVPVRAPGDNHLLFWLRCFFDLQLKTIVQHLRPAMAGLKGRILDVGAGESPWRGWLPADSSYYGLDVDSAADFGLKRRPDVTYYNGRELPFADEFFDGALCIEVLEHAEDPELLLAEIYRVIKPEAPLLLSVPWSARNHHLPHDFHRFTRERLAIMFKAAGFTGLVIRERGNDVCVIANKLIILTLRLLKPFRIGALPLALLLAPFTAAMLLAAWVAGGRGGAEDPLGYFVTASRP